jgi:hypothetical protein
MTFQRIWKIVRNNPALTPEDRELIRQKVHEEIDTEFGFAPEPNHAEDKKTAASEGQKQLMLRGSKKVQVTQFRVWKTVEACAEELGRDLDDIIPKVTDKTLTSKRYSPNFTLVHVGQVEHWFKTGLKLDNISTSVFDGWLRQAEIVAKYNITAQDLSLWATKGKIAVFKPAPRLVLLNEQEVLEYATREKKSKQ